MIRAPRRERACVDRGRLSAWLTEVFLPQFRAARMRGYSARRARVLALRPRGRPVADRASVGNRTDKTKMIRGEDGRPGRSRFPAAGDAIEAERLRKAEEFIEQDEGATNRLSGWAGTHRDRDRGRDVAVPPLRGLRNRADPGTALHARRLRAAAGLPAVSGGRALPRPHPLVGRDRRPDLCRHPDLCDRGRRRLHRPRHDAEPHRRHSRRHLHRAAGRGDAAHHRPDRADHRAAVYRLCAGGPLSAAAVESSRLRLRCAGRASVHHAGRHFRRAGRCVRDPDRAVHDLRRLPAAIRRRQVLHRLLDDADGQASRTRPAAPWCCRRSCSAVRRARASRPR